MEGRRILYISFIFSSTLATDGLDSGQNALSDFHIGQWLGRGPQPYRDMKIEAGFSSRSYVRLCYRSLLMFLLSVGKERETAIDKQLCYE
jgi:hypothetical protein